MLYLIILQPISQASRKKFDQMPKRSLQIAGNRGTSLPVWPVPFDNMGAERKKAALPGASQQIAANRSQCVPGIRLHQARKSCRAEIERFFYLAGYTGRVEDESVLLSLIIYFIYTAQLTKWRPQFVP